MLVSVFTPSHDPKWLLDAYRTLQRQTYAKWEWVVVANGPQTNAVTAAVAHAANGDKRVRVVKYPEQEEAIKVGALKRFACDVCKGDIFLELDHDDLLTHDCLAAVVEAAGRCPDATFIYSDNVTCDLNGVSTVYREDFGWRKYGWEYEKKKYEVHKMFPISARSLCEILYAPDHVRAWTRDAYLITGGHSQEMVLADDHELIIRTYLKGIHFEYIQRPLYFHRQDGNTTSQVRVLEIQRLSYYNRNVYLYRLIEEWCRRSGLEMWDIGDPASGPPRYKSLWHDETADIPWTLGQNPRLKDILPKNVGVLRAFDYLQTLTPKDTVNFMNQAYEVLPQGSWLLTQTPAIADDEGKIGRGAFQDPSHQSFWSQNNFWYYTDKNFARYRPEIRCRFQGVRGFHYYPNDWHKQHQMPCVLFDMIAIKNDDHHPGPVDI